jgi:Sel1 repeat
VSANRLVFMVLLLLSVAAFQLPAQQTEADRKPFEELKAKAEAGDAESEYQVGLAYTKGQGVTKNEVEAVKWYRKAAEQGNAAAQDNLGVCCAKGQGVAKDEVEAVKWFREKPDIEYADIEVVQAKEAKISEHGDGFMNEEKYNATDKITLEWARKVNRSIDREIRQLTLLRGGRRGKFVYYK